MTYFKVKTANFAERWQVCTPVEVAAQIIAPARLDLPLIEYSWEFCRIAKAIAFDDATILSLFWHGANLHRLVDLPDTTGLKWREGILRCLESFLPWARASPPAIVRSSHMPATVRGSFTPAVRSPRKPAAVRGQSRPASSEYGKTACSEFGKPAGHSSFQASASTGPSRACSSTAPSRSRSSTTPSSASPSIALSCACASSAPCSSSPSSVLGCARASQASALPECLCFQSAPKCPRPQKSAPPERPQESMPPEWPRCLIDPLFSPRNFFWGVVGLQPLRLGPQPLRQSRHGLPSPRIHHGRPNSLLRHGHPSPLIRYGCPSSPAPPWVPERALPWRPPVLSPCPWRPPERPPPLPVGWCPTPFGRVE